MKRIFELVTHNDGDASGASILFKSFFKKGRVSYCNYKNIDDTLLKIANNIDKDNTTLFIVDICPSESTIVHLINNGIDFKIIDHHKSAIGMNKYVNYVKIDVSYCGSMLFRNFILDNFCKLALEVGTATKESISKYDELLMYIDDYDRWIHAYSHSLKLNTLFGLVGMDRFVDRFLNNPSVNLTESEKYLLSIEEDNVDRYIKETLRSVSTYTDKKGNIFGIVFAERYISLLGHAMNNELDIDYAVIVNLKTNIVSYRSVNKIDVTELAGLIGGGGHPNSSGAEINKFNKNLIVESVIDKIKL